MMMMMMIMMMMIMTMMITASIVGSMYGTQTLLTFTIETNHSWRLIYHTMDRSYGLWMAVVVRFVCFGCDLFKISSYTSFDEVSGFSAHTSMKF